MSEKTLTLKQKDGHITKIHMLLCEKTPAASIVLFHGMAEHHSRYLPFAQILNEAGLDVYLFDHRGHGSGAAADELGFIAPKNGSRLLIGDALSVLSFVRRQKRTEALFLFAHSMGSLIARCAIQEDDKLSGVLVCGTTCPPGLVTKGGLFLTSLVSRIKGPDHRSPFLDHVLFGGHAYTSLSTRTKMDWLTRDTAVVSSYNEDPLCGFLCTASFYHDLVSLASFAAKPERILKTAADLPIFFLSGDKDPVGGYGKEVRKIAGFYRSHGYTDIKLTLYPDCRHELLNEINRGDIIQDVIHWIKDHNTKAYQNRL